MPHYFRCLHQGGFLFFTGAGVCACEFFCSSLEQVSVPRRFSVPHWFRRLGLEGCLIPTSATSSF